MTETVQIGKAVLYRADARDILPDLAIDVMLTDPVWPNCPPGLLAGADNPFALWTETMAATPELLRLIVVMRRDSDPRFLAPIPDHIRFLCAIDLPYAIPSNIGRVLGSHEIAYWFGQPVACTPGRRLVAGRGPTAQPFDRQPNGHPCARPQVHFDWLVARATDPGDIVCDPFMGSGTTGVSCVKHGRPFVGIEIDARYFDIACKRIEEEHAQSSLFDPAELVS